MAIFSKEKTEEKEEEKKTPVKNSEAKKKKAEAVLNTKNSHIAYSVLIEPWITEKSHAMMGVNKYVFKVSKTASKTDVKKAIEGMYGVKVEKTAVVNIPSRTKNFGRHAGVKAGFKKAVVTLKSGDSIELFGGAQ